MMTRALESKPSLHTVMAACLALVLVVSGSSSVSADDLTGEQIYRAQCADCHGARGEGSMVDYPHPLIGDRNVDQLTRLIDRTMPQGAPEECIGDDARKVAEYVFENFYSHEAQAKNQPPRVALSRLTVRQYRNAIADLIGSFRGTKSWGEESGLRGAYYKSRRFRNEDRVIDRVDAGVNFDFGPKSPADGELENNNFSIQWEGSVLAPETGEYEFVVRTEHATRLWLNDLRQPFIDAWVKSGNDTEYRGTVFLLEGRAYPIRLEFSKAKQGVNDEDKKRAEAEIPASISLNWIRPHRAEEIIPARLLSPIVFPELYVVSNPFPPDDRSIGYERGTSISKAWDEATTEAAIATSAYILDHLRDLVGVGERTPPKERPQKIREFARTFVERAFRRPLTPEIESLYVERPFAESEEPELGLKRSVLLTLLSPRFLYREVGTEASDSFDRAARLSFAIWDSIPDAKLLEAARNNQLETREQVVAQAQRMLDDLRTRSKTREFLLQWLKLDLPHDLGKNPELYPGFDEKAISDLKTSLDIFLEQVVWSDSSDFRRLLLAETVPLNGRLAKLYGVELSDDEAFQDVPLNSGVSAGVLTHPYLLASFAYTDTSSPIHRGVFLARNVLGRALRTPPAAFSPFPADLHPDLTTRERVTLQTKSEDCMTCHSLINPLGYSLENFDAIGRYRENENDKPVDAKFLYETLEGDSLELEGPRALAEFVVDNGEAPSTFVERLFHYMIKQPVRAYGPYTETQLIDSFMAADYNIKQLMVEIATTGTLGPQPADPLGQ